MIYLIHRPITGDVVGMTEAEATEFLNVPDHRGLDFKVETYEDIEIHHCAEMPVEKEVPRD